MGLIAETDTLVHAPIHRCADYRELVATVAGSDKHDRSHLVDPDVGRLLQVEFGLMRWNAKIQRLHHLAVFDPFHMLFVGVAHWGRLTRFLCRETSNTSGACKHLATGVH